MLASLRNWFHSIPINDPLDRRHAYLLQVMMVILAVFNLIAIPPSFLISATLAEGLRTNISNVLIFCFSVSGIAMLRRGRLGQSVLLVGGGVMLGLGTLLVFEGVRNSGWMLSAFMIPITLCGLLTGRRDMLLIAGANIALVLTIGLLEALTSGIVGLFPRQGDVLGPTLSTFILVSLLVVLFFWQFSNSFREALKQTLAREQDLKGIRENLELLVAERTAQLTAINQTMRKDLELARDIQLGLLPPQVPWDQRRLRGWGQSLPALEVGGDFYTFISFDDPRYAGVAIGDISGKGVGAALLMALMISAVEAEAQVSRQPGAVLTAINQRFYERLKLNNMNVALLYLLIDLDEQRLHVANAGLVYPLIIGGGQQREIEAAGLPLGSLPIIEYRQRAEQLLRGETIVLQTDGVAESHNRSGEMFGFERMEAVLARPQESIAPEQAVAALFQAVESFTDGAPQHDDITVVAIQMR